MVGVNHDMLLGQGGGMLTDRLGKMDPVEPEPTLIYLPVVFNLSLVSVEPEPNLIYLPVIFKAETPFRLNIQTKPVENGTVGSQGVKSPPFHTTNRPIFTHKINPSTRVRWGGQAGVTAAPFQAWHDMTYTDNEIQ